ncbi:MAG: hypothetical protein U1E27_13625 [Kiritimatiellia bacterium]|nr:hypothetical protein [Kiritimatiellia bacterium]
MNENSPAPQDWYLRKEDGTVYGPASPETLRNWAADGRVEPVDSVSSDRLNWIAAPDRAELGLDWMVLVPDADPYGPVHLRSLLDLAADGGLPPDTRVHHLRDGRRLSLRALALTEGRPLPESPVADSANVAAAPAASPAPAPAQPPSWTHMARERDRFEQEARRWKNLYETDLATTEGKSRSLQTALEEQVRETEILRSELDHSRIEIEQIRRQRERTGPNASQNGFDAAFLELSKCYEALAEQLADKTQELTVARESLARSKDTNENRLAYLEKQLEAERQEAHEARLRQARSEEAYQQIVQSLRELNFHFIRLKDAAPASNAAPETVLRPDSTGAGSTGAGKSHIRLTR